MNTYLKQLPLVVYLCIVLLSFLGGGVAVNLYGQYCGINIFEPSAWVRTFVIMGSPLCKSLNWVGYMMGNVVEHMWFHLINLMVTTFLTFIPGKKK